MMDQVQVAKNKMMRGQVLRTLALFYPSQVSIGSIKNSLLTRGLTISNDTSKILHYLKGKGYINITEGGLRDIEDDDLIELTAKGVDLVEGTIDDPGVDI